MKKRTLVLLCQICLLASCSRTSADGSASIDDSSHDSSDAPISNVDNTIDDAKDSSGRPDFGKDFDYEPGYTPEESKPVKVTVTISENTTLTFKDGTKSMEIDSNYLFKEEDFDLSKLSEDHKLAGFALYLGEDSEYKGMFAFGALRAPRQNFTIRPYFDVTTGFTALDIGSGSNSKFNFDQVPGTITDNKTIQYNGDDVLVDGGSNGYTEKGVSFVETSRVDINSAMRLDTKAAIDTAGVYEFTYNFSNLGSTPIYFDAYQIAASAEYKGKTDYENRYRMDIDLQPGESMSYTAQYSLTTNTNALTYFVADRTMKDGFSLGMSMAFKKTDLQQVDSKYVSQPEAATKGKVTLDLPSGISVAGYESEQTAGMPIAIPQDSAITNTTGKTIAGWYIVGEPIRFIKSTTVVSDIEDYTIAPYFAPESGTSLIPGNGSKTSLPDYTGHTGEDGKLEAVDDDFASFTSKDVILDGLAAKNFASGYSFAKGDFFRLLTASSVEANGNYRFHYTLKNNLATAVSLTVYQVQGGIKATAEEGAVSHTLTIEPGAVSKFDIEIQIQSKNSNVMSVFVLDAASTGLNLDVAIAQEKFTPVKTSTLTIGGTSGITFEDGKTTASLMTGDKLPAIKNDTGKTLLGFLDENGNKYTVESFEMPATDITLYPYFAPEHGTALVPGSGSKTKLPDYYGHTNDKGELEKDKTDFTGISMSDVVVDNVLGRKVSSEYEFAKGDFFRLLTANHVDAARTYRFHYTLKNNLATALSLSVYQVQGGIEISEASGAVSHTLTLEPGAVSKFDIDIKIQKNNENVMSVLVLDAASKGLNLDVAMSVEDVTPVTTSTLTLSGNSGVTFEDGSMTKTLQSGDKLPAIKNETGRTLAGFYDEQGKKYTVDGFVMPSEDITLRPYFAVRDGYTRLWAMSAQNGGVPGNFSGTLSSSSFEKTNSGTAGYNTTLAAYKTIVKEENGFDEEGVILKSTVNLKKDDAFRMNTAASPKSGEKPVILKAEHSYIYTFENRGTSTVSFDVYAVNSGVDKSSGTNNHVELTVEAGKTKTIEIKPTFTGGSANANTLTYFVAKTDMDKLNLAIAMSAKFAK